MSRRLYDPVVVLGLVIACAIFATSEESPQVVNEDELGVLWSKAGTSHTDSMMGLGDSREQKPQEQEGPNDYLQILAKVQQSCPGATLKCPQDGDPDVTNLKNPEPKAVHKQTTVREAHPSGSRKSISSSGSPESFDRLVDEALTDPTVNQTVRGSKKQHHHDGSATPSKHRDHAPCVRLTSPLGMMCSSYQQVEQTDATSQYLGLVGTHRIGKMNAGFVSQRSQLQSELVEEKQNERLCVNTLVPPLKESIAKRQLDTSNRRARLHASTLKHERVTQKSEILLKRAAEEITRLTADHKARSSAIKESPDSPYDKADALFKLGVSFDRADRKARQQMKNLKYQSTTRKTTYIRLRHENEYKISENQMEIRVAQMKIKHEQENCRTTTTEKVRLNLLKGSKHSMDLSCPSVISHIRDKDLELDSCGSDQHKGCREKRQFDSCEGGSGHWMYHPSKDQVSQTCHAFSDLLKKEDSLVMTRGVLDKQASAIQLVTKRHKFCNNDPREAAVLRQPICSEAEKTAREATWARVRGARDLDKTCAKLVGVSSKETFEWTCVTAKPVPIGRAFAPNPWYATGKDAFQWLMLDLGGLRQVQGLIMQGNGGCAGVRNSICQPQKDSDKVLRPSFVYRYQVSSSFDGKNWMYLSNDPGKAKMFGHDCTIDSPLTDPRCAPFVPHRDYIWRLEKQCHKVIRPATTSTAKPQISYSCVGTEFKESDWICPPSNSKLGSFGIRHRGRHYQTKCSKVNSEKICQCQCIDLRDNRASSCSFENHQCSNKRASSCSLRDRVQGITRSGKWSWYGLRYAGPSNFPFVAGKVPLSAAMFAFKKYHLQTRVQLLEAEALRIQGNLNKEKTAKKAKLKVRVADMRTQRKQRERQRKTSRKVAHSVERKEKTRHRYKSILEDREMREEEAHMRFDTAMAEFQAAKDQSEAEKSNFEANLKREQAQLDYSNARASHKIEKKRALQEAKRAASKAALRYTEERTTKKKQQADRTQARHVEQNQKNAHRNAKKDSDKVRRYNLELSERRDKKEVTAERRDKTKERENAQADKKRTKCIEDASEHTRSKKEQANKVETKAMGIKNLEKQIERVTKVGAKTGLQAMRSSLLKLQSELKGMQKQDAEYATIFANWSATRLTLLAPLTSFSAYDDDCSGILTNAEVYHPLAKSPKWVGLGLAEPMNRTTWMKANEQSPRYQKPMTTCKSMMTSATSYRNEVRTYWLKMKIGKSGHLSEMIRMDEIYFLKVADRTVSREKERCRLLNEARRFENIERRNTEQRLYITAKVTEYHEKLISARSKAKRADQRLMDTAKRQMGQTEERMQFIRGKLASDDDKFTEGSEEHKFMSVRNRTATMVKTYSSALQFERIQDRLKQEEDKHGWQVASKERRYRAKSELEKRQKTRMHQLDMKSGALTHADATVQAAKELLQKATTKTKALKLEAKMSTNAIRKDVIITEAKMSARFEDSRRQTVETAQKRFAKLKATRVNDEIKVEAQGSKEEMARFQRAAKARASRIEALKVRVDRELRQMRKLNATVLVSHTRLDSYIKKSMQASGLNAAFDGKKIIWNQGKASHWVRSLHFTSHQALHTQRQIDTFKTQTKRAIKHAQELLLQSPTESCLKRLQEAHQSYNISFAAALETKSVYFKFKVQHREEQEQFERVKGLVTKEHTAKHTGRTDTQIVEQSKRHLKQNEIIAMNEQRHLVTDSKQRTNYRDSKHKEHAQKMKGKDKATKAQLEIKFKFSDTKRRQTLSAERQLKSAKSPGNLSSAIVVDEEFRTRFTAAEKQVISLTQQTRAMLTSTLERLGSAAGLPGITTEDIRIRQRLQNATSTLYQAAKLWKLSSQVRYIAASKSGYLPRTTLCHKTGCHIFKHFRRHQHWCEYSATAWMEPARCALGTSDQLAPLIAAAASVTAASDAERLSRMKSDWSKHDLRIEERAFATDHRKQEEKEKNRQSISLKDAEDGYREARSWQKLSMGNNASVQTKSNDDAGKLAIQLITKHKTVQKLLEASKQQLALKSSKRAGAVLIAKEVSTKQRTHRQLEYTAFDSRFQATKNAFSKVQADQRDEITQKQTRFKIREREQKLAYTKDTHKHAALQKEFADQQKEKARLVNVEKARKAVLKSVKEATEKWQQGAQSKIVSKIQELEQEQAKLVVNTIEETRALARVGSSDYLRSRDQLERLVKRLDAKAVKENLAWKAVRQAHQNQLRAQRMVYQVALKAEQAYDKIRQFKYRKADVSARNDELETAKNTEVASIRARHRLEERHLSDKLSAITSLKTKSHAALRQSQHNRNLAQNKASAIHNELRHESSLMIKSEQRMAHNQQRWACLISNKARHVDSISKQWERAQTDRSTAVTQFTARFPSDQDQDSRTFTKARDSRDAVIKLAASMRKSCLESNAAPTHQRKFETNERQSKHIRHNKEREVKHHGRKADEEIRTKYHISVQRFNKWRCLNHGRCPSAKRLAQVMVEYEQMDSLQAAKLQKEQMKRLRRQEETLAEKMKADVARMKANSFRLQLQAKEQKHKRERYWERIQSEELLEAQRSQEQKAKLESRHLRNLQRISDQGNNRVRTYSSSQQTRRVELTTALGQTSSGDADKALFSKQTLDKLRGHAKQVMLEGQAEIQTHNAAHLRNTPEGDFKLADGAGKALQEMVPFQARYIRIHPKQWVGSRPAMRIEVFGTTQCNLEPDAALGMAAKYIPSTHVNASSSVDSDHTGTQGTLFSAHAWNSKPFYICPDKIFEGSHQSVPQSMCAPDVGAIEPWRLLQSKGDRYLFKKAPEARMQLIKEEEMAHNRAQGPKRACVSSAAVFPSNTRTLPNVQNATSETRWPATSTKCVSYQHKNASNAVAQLRKEQAKVKTQLLESSKDYSKRTQKENLTIDALAQIALEAERASDKATKQYDTANKRLEDIKKKHISGAIADVQNEEIFMGMKPEDKRDKTKDNLEEYFEDAEDKCHESNSQSCKPLCGKLFHSKHRSEVCTLEGDKQRAQKIKKKGEEAQQAVTDARRDQTKRVAQEKRQKEMEMRTIPRLIAKVEAAVGSELRWKQSVAIQKEESTHLSRALVGQIAFSTNVRKDALDRNMQILSRGHSVETRNQLKEVTVGGKKKRVEGYRYQSECERLVWDSKATLPVAKELAQFKRKNQYSQTALKDEKDESQEPQKCGDGIITANKFVNGFDTGMWASKHPNQVLEYDVSEKKTGWLRRLQSVSNCRIYPKLKAPLAIECVTAMDNAAYPKHMLLAAANAKASGASGFLNQKLNSGSSDPSTPGVDEQCLCIDPKTNQKTMFCPKNDKCKWQVMLKEKLLTIDGEREKQTESLDSMVNAWQSYNPGYVLEVQMNDNRDVTKCLLYKAKPCEGEMSSLTLHSGTTKEKLWRGLDPGYQMTLGDWQCGRFGMTGAHNEACPRNGVHKDKSERFRIWSRNSAYGVWLGQLPQWKKQHPDYQRVLDLLRLGHRFTLEYKTLGNKHKWRGKNPGSVLHYHRYSRNQQKLMEKHAFLKVRPTEKPGMAGCSVRRVNPKWPVAWVAKLKEMQDRNTAPGSPGAFKHREIMKKGTADGWDKAYNKSQDKFWGKKFDYQKPKFDEFGMLKQNSNDPGIRLPLACERGRFDVLNPILTKMLEEGKIFVSKESDPKDASSAKQWKMNGNNNKGEWKPCLQLQQKLADVRKRLQASHSRSQEALESWAAHIMSRDSCMQTARADPKKANSQGLCFNVHGMRQSENSERTAKSKHMLSIKARIKSKLKQHLVEVEKKQAAANQNKEDQQKKLRLANEQQRKEDKRMEEAVQSTQLLNRIRRYKQEAHTKRQEIARRVRLLIRLKQSPRNNAHIKKLKTELNQALMRLGKEEKRQKERTLTTKQKAEEKEKEDKEEKKKKKKRDAKREEEQMEEIAAAGVEDAKSAEKKRAWKDAEEQMAESSRKFSKTRRSNMQTVVGAIRKHYTVMKQNDPEWQMIARKKATNILPGEKWMDQFLEVRLCTDEICPPALITALVTQPDPEQLSWVYRYKVSYSLGECAQQMLHGRCPGGMWKPSVWSFYATGATSSQKQQTFENSGDVLQGSAPPLESEVQGPTWRQWDSNGWSTSLAASRVTKTIIELPFKARFIRIHPVCWHGPSMSLRAEIYAKSTSFDWSPLKNLDRMSCGTPTMPGSIMFAAASSFNTWTDGLDGGGLVYESGPTHISVQGITYSFTAYQRRVVRGRGMLTKQLVCYRGVESLGEGKPLSAAGETKSSNGETCCVAKSSKPFGQDWPEQEVHTKMF